MRVTEKIRGYDFIRDTIIKGCEVTGIELIDEKKVDDDILSDYEMTISFDDTNEDVQAIIKRVEETLVVTKNENDKCIEFHLKDHDTVDAKAFEDEFYKWFNNHSPWEKEEIRNSPDFEAALLEIEGIKDLEKAYKDPDTYYANTRMSYFGDFISDAGQSPVELGDTVLMYDYKTGKHYTVDKKDIDF